MMGGILSACGVKGFLCNRIAKIGQNSDSERWGALVEAWPKVLTKHIASTTELIGLIRDNSDLAEQFADVLGDGSDLSQRQKLAHALQRMDGRVFGDRSGSALRLTRAEQRSSGRAVIWQLEPAIKSNQEGENATETGTDPDEPVAREDPNDIPF